MSRDQQRPVPSGRQGLTNWDVNAHTRRASKSGSHPGKAVVEVEEDPGESVEREDPGLNAAPLFVYGTLMSGAVMEALLGRVPPMESALCFEHKRFPANQQVFSGMLPTELWENAAAHEGWSEPEGAERGSLVVGQACFGLKMQERKLLDSFTDEEYSLVPVRIQIAEDDRLVEAVTYMWQECYIDGLAWKGEDWDFGKFQQSHLNDYLEKCKEFRMEFLAHHLSNEELEDLTGRKLPTRSLF